MDRALEFLRALFTKHVGLKVTALILALALWFYVVDELKKGSEDEIQLLTKIMPREGIVAKKLLIRPIVVGKPRGGYVADTTRAVVVPEYCIVVGTRDLLGKIRHAYTMPIDVNGAHKTITESVPLNPIAPGVYMEETTVQVTVPVERPNP